LLVQAGSSGSERIDTRWPGHVLVILPKGSPPVDRGSWCLVEGTLTVEGPSEALKPAFLAATTLLACNQDRCADAQDPNAIMDHKLSALNGN
jgi:hypothetical protein